MLFLDYFLEADGNTSSYLTDEAIYAGYTILVLIMEAIHLSCEFKDIVKSKGIDLSNISYETIKKSDVDDPENDHLASYVDFYGCQKGYSKFVVERLEEAKKQLKTLFPLSFRVEILENIFSMLFLMVQNLVDFSELHYDSDQGHEGEAHLYEKLDSFSAKSGEFHDKKYEDKFVISTVKLKDNFMFKNEVTENVSGHVSSKSTESTSSTGFQIHMFLCNELITRDLLSLLKDSVYEAKSETYGMIRSSDTKIAQVRNIFIF